MRVIEKEEKDKRGCLYCLDVKTVAGYKKCKYDKCPYSELDGFETYEDFFHSQAGLLDMFFEDEVTEYEY